MLIHEMIEIVEYSIKRSADPECDTLERIRLIGLVFTLQQSIISRLLIERSESPKLKLVKAA
jgi:hypothetical protein